MNQNNQEIERKFLVTEAFAETMRQASGGSRIYQGYLLKDDNSSVRIRLKDDKGYLTYKAGKGVVRTEIETEIPLKVAEDLLNECEYQIRKTRFTKEIGGFIWEIDVFEDGLVMAEIELPTEDTLFGKPAWTTDEVTGDPKYLNQNMAKKVK